MKIRKVKIKKAEGDKPGAISISYQRGEDLFTMVCHDQAMPAFYTAAANLGDHAMELLELTKKYGKTATVVSVSLSYKYDKGTDSELTLASISIAKRLLCGQVVSLVTPEKACILATDKGMALYCHTAECIDAINWFIEQAANYVGGDRAQSEMGLD